MNTEQTPVTPAAEAPATPAPAESAPARTDGRPPRGGDRGGDRGDRRGGPRGPKPPEKRVMRFEHDPMANMPKLRDLDSAIEAELNAAMTDFQPEKELGALSAHPKPEPATDGKKRGTVLSIHGGDIFIDVPGGRGQGVMSALQFTEQPKVGDVVEFAIEGYDGANGLLKLAKAGAAQVVLDWSGLVVGKVVEARVIAVNKGGLQVEVNGIRGFLPMGQIDTFHIDNPEAFVNQRLLVSITEVSPAERNLVVSRRRLMEIERKQKEAAFWETIEEGQIREGTVKGIKPFGVFVDLGGADGLVPMGELAWARVTTVESVVTPGQQVKVKVMRVDKENRKIGLSLREMSANPFDGVAERVNVGTKVIGKITRIEDFGAFVEIEPGIEGLLHISELGNNRVRRVRDAVKEGQEVEVQVISIDRATRRISLSLKAIANAEMYKAQEEERIENEKYKSGGATPRPKTEGLRGGITDGGKALLEQLAKKYK